MFDVEGIIDITVDEALTPDRMREYVLKTLIPGDDRSTAAVDFPAYFLPASNSDFRIRGTAKGFPPFLISPAAQKNLLYIQNLALLDMESDYFTSRSEVDSCMLIYTISGQGRMKAGNMDFTLKKGSICLVDCNNPHYYHTDADHWAHFVLHFTGAAAPVLLSSLMEKGAFLCEDRDYPYMLSNLERIVRVYMAVSRNRDLEINYLLTKIITDLTLLKSKTTDRPDPKSEDAVRGAVSYMKENLQNPIRLDDIASSVHLSKYYFSHEFLLYTGYSPIDYLILLRIERAKILLRTTDYTIGEIADMVGYPNEQHFSKIFKARTGMAPGRYRK